MAPPPPASSAGVADADDASPRQHLRPLGAVVAEGVKRTLVMFSADSANSRIPVDEESHRAKIACKIRDEYAAARDVFKNREEAAAAVARVLGTGGDDGEAATGKKTSAAAEPLSSKPAASSKTTTGRIIDSVAAGAAAKAGAAAAAGATIGKPQQPSSSLLAVAPPPVQASASAPSTSAPSSSSFDQLARRMPAKWPRPKWHPHWRCYRVVSGHLGWVRSLAVDPVSNEWFASGSADRTIKIWDLATGKLRLTLTGHIEQVTGLAISDRHPYLFSCSLDKEVKCWDLEANKVVRNYHGHLSGVFCLGLHPALDMLVSGGRDSTARVWDMRSRVQAACLTGHADAVCSLFCQASDPQVVTGSADKTVKLWDIRKTPAKAVATLTYAKKSVRALAPHPTEFTLAACSADAIKKYKLPGGEFLHNTLQRHPAIVNCCSVNEDGVFATGGDDGSLRFWDWRSGNCFQEAQSIAQPGSLEAEAGMFASTFDATGSRFLTAEADKTIKFWKEDENSSPETHPVRFVPPQMAHRY